MAGRGLCGQNGVIADLEVARDPDLAGQESRGRRSPNACQSGLTARINASSPTVHEWPIWTRLSIFVPRLYPGLTHRRAFDRGVCADLDVVLKNDATYLWVSLATFCLRFAHIQIHEIRSSNYFELCIADRSRNFRGPTHQNGSLLSRPILTPS